MSDELFAQIKQSVIDGEVEDAERFAHRGLDAGLSAGDPIKAVATAKAILGVE